MCAPWLVPKEVTILQCRYCGCDPNPAILIPAHVDEQYGDSPFACEPCAVKHGIYCPRHQVAHLGFIDGTHGCTYCSAETAATHESLGVDLIMYVNGEFAEEEIERIDEYLDQVNTGEGFPAPRHLIRVLAMVAQRSGRTLEQAIEAFKRGRSAAPVAHGTLPSFQAPDKDPS